MDCLQLHTEKEKTRKDYAIRVDPKPRLKKTPSVRYLYIYIYISEANWHPNDSSVAMALSIIGPSRPWMWLLRRLNHHRLTDLRCLEPASS